MISQLLSGRSLLALGSLLLGTGLAAEPVGDPVDQLHELLKETVTHAILTQYNGANRENISVDITLPGTVQTLTPCSEEPDIEASRDRWLGNIRLSVRCSDTPGWALNVRGTSTLALPVAVLKHALPRNHVLTENDITFHEQDIATLRQGYFTTADAVVGSALVRNLNSNQILTHRNTEVPPMIERGDQVTILVRGDGLVVSMEGTALGDGVHGRQISVRNNSSERTVRAWVVDRGVVEVPFVSR